MNDDGDDAASSRQVAGQGRRGPLLPASTEARVSRGRRRLAHCSAALALLFGATGIAMAAAAAAAAASALPAPGRSMATAAAVPGAASSARAGALPPAAAGPGDGRNTVLVVGDSLSAEYGLTRGHGWVALMQQRLGARKIDARVVNASISGETTAGGRSRLEPLLAEYHPRLVVLELGGNDALRGLPLDGTRANLAQMSEAAKAAGAGVVIVGMQVPPNYGRRYSDDFAGLFGSVAKAEGAALVPFMLKGVADVPDYPARFQPDGIHPKESQHPIILDNIWPVVEPLLKAR